MTTADKLPAGHAHRFAAALSRSDLPRDKRPEVMVLQGGWKAWRAAYGESELVEGDGP